MPVIIDHPVAGPPCATFDAYDSEPHIGRAPVEVQCHYCGFGPLDATRRAERRCPKCKGHTWDRLVHRLVG